MPELGEEGLDARRRVGLEMQARLPAPARHPRPNPVVDRLGDTADIGFRLADLGPVGLLIGALAGLVWLVAGRKRPARYARIRAAGACHATHGMVHLVDLAPLIEARLRTEVSPLQAALVAAVDAQDRSALKDGRGACVGTFDG